jgi:flagellum-specific peptidoglycan hydrolase FlgJ
MKQRVFNILISFAVGVLGVVQVLPYLKGDKPPEIKVVHIINEEQPDFFSKSPQEGLIEALEYYKVKHPQIVYAQAVLETGHFKSDLCLNGNNLFGLYNSKKHRYYTFDHWKDCIIAYKEMIQYKYKDGDDYLNFLKEIGYAEDSEYICKLKKLIKNPP